MDDEYDEFGMGSMAPASRRFVPVDLLVLSLHFVSEITSAVHSTAVAAYNLAAMHANHMSDQRNFRDQAAREIESLTTGEAEDG